MKRWIRHLEMEVESFILLAIVLLNIFDALELLSGDLDYVKKIISWAALGYLVYRVKLSEVFVGENDKVINLSLIAGYFLLTLKSLVSYAQVEVNEASIFLKDFFVSVVNNAATIEMWGVYLGLALLLFACIRLSFLHIRQPSVLHVLHAKEYRPENGRQFLSRFLGVLLVVFGFFVVFFNLMMEWLAIAIDAPLLMIGLAVYVFYIIRHKDKFSKNSFLKKFGDFGSKLYKDVIRHIQYRKTFFRTISAMIVLHVITDAFIFVWPFLFGIGDKLYLGMLSEPHLSMLTLFSSQAASLSILESVSLLVVYLGNVIALLFFLLFPAYTWFVLYKNKSIRPRKIHLSIIVSSLILFFISPVFVLKPLSGQMIFGVDIIGQQASGIASFSTIVIFALACGIMVELYSHSIQHERWVVLCLIFLSQFFLLMYMASYLYSISGFYLSAIPEVFGSSMMLLLLFYCFMFLTTIVFYVVGTGSFLIDTHKHASKHIMLEQKRF